MVLPMFKSKMRAEWCEFKTEWSEMQEDRGREALAEKKLTPTQRCIKRCDQDMVLPRSIVGKGCVTSNYRPFNPRKSNMKKNRLCVINYRPLTT